MSETVSHVNVQVKGTPGGKLSKGRVPPWGGGVGRHLASARKEHLWRGRSEALWREVHIT